ncbi:Ras like protein family, member T1 [Strigomonas culicis]|uniref:Ras like protein family, member T1 n=1 Tax=Strigomonas culicis TaxID=28005 RepID=S9TKE4_9TRYP|nr:Ras like protein family, member T1 [Strigomonas culicis]|eukprot:EPY18627.1 Ras like protein family, member T1 [Strigomonas culicis]
MQKKKRCTLCLPVKVNTKSASVLFRMSFFLFLVPFFFVLLHPFPLAPFPSLFYQSSSSCEFFFFLPTVLFVIQVMNTLHVILCGTDAHRVESALQKAVEVTHTAWNKKYNFSCTSALCIDQVDKRLLLIANLIIICKGCRMPANRDAFDNKPVLSTEDAPVNGVDTIADADFYHGTVSLQELSDRATSLCVAPSHILYDSLLDCLTVAGDAALRRSFWLFDKDCDGRLKSEEMVAWRKLVDPSFRPEDMEEFLELWGSEKVQRSRECTQEEFALLHLEWLRSGQFMDAWATLYVVGTYPNGLPYTWYDLHSLRLSSDENTYLSAHAIQFFKNIYKLKDFANTADIWDVTPGCAWEEIAGFAKVDITLDTFIEQWKYLALECRERVIMYARYWGYKGESMYLFQRRACRRCRAVGESLPNTIHVLLVGTQECGKRSLIVSLTSADDTAPALFPDACDHFVSTTTFFVGKGTEEPQTIIYTAVCPERARLILTDAASSQTVDVVLLCYDATNITASSRFLMDMYSEVVRCEGALTERLPFVVVLTKADAVTSDDPLDADSGSRLEKFCIAHQLLWRPC